ncbi:2-oxoglutarate dehydrogenase, E2 component, dihydrolipoamide succinyltransferase [Granulicella sp. L46]|uniref:2-oxoglutarate dehydrogenase, E2 component, dihydrolipoamide succinyltransferase n=1 Tax=Granulicella sp. L46 TaxID=1641865 RepID=UPI00131C1545|nr:2-oxoglutarate dehydrogenase, E2 component, dihydrolipoamide succinyltransferase [Granulicella sp. L46]
MPIDVVMPQMGESITEGTLTKWLKKPGDTVARDEPLFEISTDKVDAEIPSPAAGTLGEIKVQEGATVSVGTVVCAINDSGSAEAAPPAPAASEAPQKEQTVTPAAVATAASDQAVPPPAPEASGPGTEVLMPQMGESITEGTLTKWLKKVGDTVARDEPIFEISTDKVDAEIPSPSAGVLSEIRVQEGQTVTVSTVVAVIGGGAAAPASTPKAAAVPTPSTPAPIAPVPTPAPSTAASEGLRSSPLVRKIAAENNVDLRGIQGTGASGRITKQDILGHLEGAPAPAPAVSPAPTAAPSAPTAPAAAKAAPAPTTAPLPGELVPLSKMRSIIAKRMVESKATSPHVHTVFKVDMTRIVKLREKEKNKYEQRNGVKLTYMPFITRAAVQALRKHPIVNASMQGESILYNKNINVGIAVALEWGLIVPVIKQAEEKSFLGIARAVVDLADRARSKKLAPDDVAGGTFTLTNSGIFGEQFGMPIIAQPQAAILGIGGLNKEAVVLTDKDGQDTIAIRSIQRFTLGFDHRIIDGADAGKFMSEFKAYLENWSEDIG